MRRKDKPRDDSLGRLLAAVARAGDGESVTLRDIVETLGRRSFGPLLLVPSLLIVSPLSAIPIIPSILAGLIGLIAVQMLMGRDYAWLPAALLDRQLDTDRFRRAIAFLEPLANHVDPYIRERLTWLARRPANLPPLLLVCLATVLMPLGEVVPFFTSLTAAALALFATGIMFRDGLFMLLGYAAFACGGALLFTAADLLTGLIR